MTTSPLLVPLPQQPSAHAVAASLADSCDEVPIRRFTHRCTPRSLDRDEEVLVRHPLLSYLSFL
jgi:hypothetical protein